MDHQLFEQWLFSEEPLSPEQIQAIQAHLKTCESCRQLSAAWSSVQDLFKEATAMEPLPGFTNRWKVRQEVQTKQELNRKSQKQSWITLMVSSLGAGLFLSLMIMQILTIVKAPTELLFIGIFQVTNFISQIITVGDLVTTFISITFGLLPPVYWIAVATGLTLLSILWILSLRKVFKNRRITI